jgi:hypothetical protein
MKLVGDFSWFQSSLTLAKFKQFKDNGMSGAILRAGCSFSKDVTAPRFSDYCDALDIPFGLYWYFYPGMNLDTQVRGFLEVIKSLPNIKCAFVDVEEYALSGTVFASTKLDAFYKTVWSQVSSVYPRTGIYSAKWVLDTYTPNAYKWINTAPFYWNANYVKYYTWWKTYMASLGASWDNDSKQISISNLPAIMSKIDTHRSEEALPTGISKSDLWQCITYIPFLDSQLSHYEKNQDYSICRDEDFIKLFGGTYIPPIPPVTPTTVAYIVVPLVGVNVRSSPPVNGVNGAKIGALAYQTVVNIQSNNITLGWGNIVGGRYSGGWVYLANMKVLN